MLELAELWPKLPVALCSRLAEEDCTAPFIKDGGSLRELLLSEERADRIQKSLSEWAEQTLRLAVSHFPGQMFHDEQLTASADRIGVAGAAVAAGLLELRRKGIVFASQKMWGDNVYLIPADIASIWYERLVTELNALDDVGQVTITERSEKDAADALFGLLLAVSKQPIALTKKETIPKRQLDAITAAVGLPKGAFAPIGLQYPDEQHVSAAVAVTLDFALRLGLLVKTDQKYELAENPVNEWLKLGRKQMNRTLKRLWDTGFTPSSAAARSAALVLRRLREGRWFSLHTLAQALQRSGTATDETELEHTVLTPLIGFGWLQLGLTERKERVFRLLIDRLVDDAEQADNGKLFVQPDFEVISPPDVPFSVRWELERFAERIRSDQVTTYKLSKASVTAGMRSGGQLDGLLHVLETSSRYGLPDNVGCTIRDWGRRNGKISVCEAILVRCQNEETADELASIPRLNDCLGSRLGPCDFLVLSDRLENFILLLSEHGYPVPHPRETARNGGPAIESSTNRFLFIDNGCLLFEPAAMWPKPEELFPQLRDVPAVWLKDCRAYHGSTTRQLIQTAIEWKALLRLRAGNQERLVTPKRIEDSASGWSLLAAENADTIKLRQEEWDEMQLIVPGINDTK